MITPHQILLLQKICGMFMLFLFIYTYMFVLLSDIKLVLFFYIYHPILIFIHLILIITSFFISSVSLQARENCGNTKLRVW